MKATKRSGFTLVELMVVVAILGILVAVAVPVYNAVTSRAERNTCEANRTSAIRFYHMARANDNGTLPGQMSTVLTSNLKGTEVSPGHYSGLCPAGGEFVVTTDADGMDSVSCTVHGSELGEESTPSSIKDKFDKLANLELIKEYFKSHGPSLDSEADHEAAIAPEVREALKQAGLNTDDASWRIYYRNNANQKDYNLFWTEPNIKDMAPGTEIKVTKYDALTGKYYTGTATVGKHPNKEYNFNIIDVSGMKDSDWTEFTP